MTSTTITPRVYVGTYGKYSAGSIDGAWVELGDDREEFFEKCRELHSDEADPEFMFQDYEYTFDLVSESHIDDSAFDLAVLDEDELEQLEAICNVMGAHAVLPNANLTDMISERIWGHFDSFRTFAEQHAEDCFGNEFETDFGRYFDYEAYARDLEGEFSFDADTGYVVYTC